MIAARFGRRFEAMKTLGDRVTRHALTTGNRIEPLVTGDAAYAAMLEAIGEAKRSIILETYIFDNDRIGARFVAALERAKFRGVEVRVLVDAVGARYSVPSILPTLREKASLPMCSTAMSSWGCGCPMPICAPTARSSWWTGASPLAAA